jgi:hypothetical protein
MLRWFSNGDGTDLVGYFGLQGGRKLVTLAVTFHNIVVDWCGL